MQLRNDLIVYDLQESGFRYRGYAVESSMGKEEIVVCY